MRGRPVEVLLPAGLACAVGACALAAVAFSETTARVIVVAAIVGLFAAWAANRFAALAMGAMAWCFTTGFLVHAEGELEFGRDDLGKLAAFTVVALASWACGNMRRAHRLRRLTRVRVDARRASASIAYVLPTPGAAPRHTRSRPRGVVIGRSHACQYRP
jgi:hypothetical protein